MTTLYLVLAAAYWITLSVLAGIGARNKGLSFGGYFIISLLISPVIGLVAMAVAKPGQPKPVEETAAVPVEEQRVVCPNCGKEKISGQMCPSCGSWQG